MVRSEMWRGIHGLWRYVERNVKWGARCGRVMHNVADMVRFEIRYCKAKVYGERCWCNMKCMIHTTTTQQYFTSNHISSTAHHTTSHHISHIPIPPDHTSHGVMWNSVVWNLVRCGMFCNPRCGMLCLNSS